MIRTMFLTLMAFSILGSTSAFAASKKTAAYKTAKKECLQENAGLKGKDLQKCIADKRGQKK